MWSSSVTYYIKITKFMAKKVLSKTFFILQLTGFVILCSFLLIRTLAPSWIRVRSRSSRRPPPVRRSQPPTGASRRRVKPSTTLMMMTVVDGATNWISYSPAFRSALGLAMSGDFRTFATKMVVVLSSASISSPCSLAASPFSSKRSQLDNTWEPVEQPWLDNLCQC